MRSLRLPAWFMLVCLATGALHAQQRIDSFFLRPAPVRPAFGILGAPADSASVPASPSPFRQEKSGSTAMLLSAILPGAGQVYAERYYTIPLIWGFGGYFVSQWVKADQRYHDYQKQFRQSVLEDTTYHSGNSYFLSARDFYHDQRDQFAIYIALTYILNIVDAYVGASLYGFEVSDNLGNASIRFRIPLR